MFWLLSMTSTLGKNLSKTYRKPINSYFKTYRKQPQTYQNRISTTITIIIIPIKCCWNVILSFPVFLVIYSTD